MLVAVPRAGAPEGPSQAVSLTALLQQSLFHDEPACLSASVAHSPCLHPEF